MARSRPRTRRGRRTGWKVGVLVLASVTIITLDYRGDLRGLFSGVRHAANDVVSPLSGAVDDVLRPVGSFLAGAVDHGTLEQENAKLRLQVSRDAATKGEMQRLKASYEELATLQHLPWSDVASIPAVTAAVTGQNTSNFDATVILDKGTAAGVDPGMPVVDGRGLVGQVVQATGHSAVVQLVTDTRSVVSVTYGTAGALASVDGTGPGGALSVQYVSPGTPLRTGMVLTTSSQALSSMPSGIPVARITTFRSEPTATAETVAAAPVARLSDLAYVDVLQWEPPG